MGIEDIANQAKDAAAKVATPENIDKAADAAKSVLPDSLDAKVDDLAQKAKDALGGAADTEAAPEAPAE
jgi:hypothetical protein